MTNGEKFIEVFGVGCATYDVMHDVTTIHRNGDWWDAEYEEEEEEPCDDSQPCTECPMYDTEKHYCPHFCHVIRDVFKEKEPCEDFKQKAGVVIEQLRADRDRLATALEEIKAELHGTAEMHDDGDYYLREEWIDEVFDKHKGEEGEKDEVPKM